MENNAAVQCFIEKKKIISLDTSEDCIATLEGREPRQRHLCREPPGALPCLGSPGCRPLPARSGGIAQVNALRPTTAWLAQSGCVSLSPPSSLGTAVPSSTGLAGNLLYFLFFFKFFFVKKPPHIFALFFFRRVQRTIIVQEGLVQVSITSMPWGDSPPLQTHHCRIKRTPYLRREAVVGHHETAFKPTHLKTSRERSACARDAASGNHWQRRKRERWDVPMAVSSLWQEGTGPHTWHVPAGGEWCPSCPVPTPARGLAGGKRFAEGEGRRRMREPRALRLHRAHWDKAWRERSREWRRDAPRGSWPGGRLFHPGTTPVSARLRNA
ncbi:uncharacterized protein LOC121354409 [Pyrgilauda ruficollis]|uniref:uncharacterized protein LOC121354409 n=1 Tax=Pyrgilauda ruficollis TaxID=221976 RepID=UPI001B879329|nr:uncharacterized protein LOC121354409 [Pyrgilauda ruficollis]XP_041324957.1 uncharacterized protein LOC121354409 [Pyrgilauda ruficollis]